MPSPNIQQGRTPMPPGPEHQTTPIPAWMQQQPSQALQQAFTEFNTGLRALNNTSNIMTKQLKEAIVPLVGQLANIVALVGQEAVSGYQLALLRGLSTGELGTGQPPENSVVFPVSMLYDFAAVLDDVIEWQGKVAELADVDKDTPKKELDKLGVELKELKQKNEELRNALQSVLDTLESALEDAEAEDEDEGAEAIGEGSDEDEDLVSL